VTLPYFLRVKMTIDIPDDLYRKVEVEALARRMTPEEIILTSLEKELGNSSGSYWANRELLPEYEVAMREGAFSGGTDSTVIISEDRDGGFCV
jgi:hypothetical protein